MTEASATALDEPVDTAQNAAASDDQPLWKRRPALLAAVALVALVAATFSRMTSNGFVELDIYDHVVNNPYIRGLTAENLHHILTERCIYSYYPVRTLSYAVDYQLWGLNPLGFGLTNIALHAANVLLVFWLGMRLARQPRGPDGRRWRWVMAAAFPAALFAVHPVVVEPVAWVCGREELLMTLGALGAFHAHLTALRRMSHSAAKAVLWHALAIGCMAFAALSNVVGAIVPVLLIAYDLLVLPPRLRWRGIWPVAPMLAISAVVVMLKLAADADMSSPSVATVSTGRLALVFEVFGENVKALLWPVALAPYYGRLSVPSPSDPAVIGGALAALAFVGLAWWVRRRRRVLFGLLWFLIALAPAAQIVSHHIARGDRFLYLPLVGLAVAAGAAFGRWMPRLRGSAVLVMVPAVALLVPLNWLSSRQVAAWRDDTSLWRHCVAVGPHNPSAHVALATHLHALAEESDDQAEKAALYAEAKTHYAQAVALDPNHLDAVLGYADFLSGCQIDSQRDFTEAAKLASHAVKVTGGRELAAKVALASVYERQATDLAWRGEVGPAIYFFQRSIESDPSYDQPYLKLALLLMECRDPLLRNTHEAVALAETACRLSQFNDPYGLSVFSAALAADNRPKDALTTVNRAIGIARTTGDGELLPELERRRDTYRKRAGGA